LFDGMSGCQQALNRAGIDFENYYSCEIDKFCNQVVSANFPKTVQMGDVTKVTGENLPKIDLLVCGSPCQGFSFAGKMLNFSDPRSALFFEAVRILNECRVKNPNILFLFENVRMKLEYELVFTKYLGVEPILINSALLSAQNRNRLYWTNIASVPSNLFGDLKTQIKQPKDKGIFLRDILEDEVDEKYYLSDKMIKGLLTHTDKHKEKGNGFSFTTKNENDKAFSVTTKPGQRATDNFIEKRVIQINPCKKSGGKQPQQQDRIYDENGISPALMAQLSSGSNYVQTSSNIRRLTPREVCRLQCVDYDSIFVHNGVQIVSDTQVYKMNGNGFTVDVIAYILNHITFSQAK